MYNKNKKKKLKNLSMLLLGLKPWSPVYLRGTSTTVLERERERGQILTLKQRALSCICIYIYMLKN